MMPCTSTGSSPHGVRSDLSAVQPADGGEHAAGDRGGGEPGLYSAAGYFESLATAYGLDFERRYAHRFGVDSPMLNSLGESCYEGVKLLAELVRAAGSTELPDVSAVAEIRVLRGRPRAAAHPRTTTSTSRSICRWPTGSSSTCSASCERGSTSVPRGWIRRDSYSGLGTTRTGRCWRPITPCETEGSISRDSACRTPHLEYPNDHQRVLIRRHPREFACRVAMAVS